MGRILIALMIVSGIAAALVLMVSVFDGTGVKEVDSFEDCVEANGIVAESYPRQCFTEDGKTFTEEGDIELPEEITETEEEAES